MSNKKIAREDRKRMGAQTLEIIERGHYDTDEGTRVRVASDIERCVDSTQMVLPDELELMLSAAKRRVDTSTSLARIEVTTETTLEAGARLTRTSSRPIGVLNFASARNPGGGFLNGSQAQEESLARSSALYASQVACQKDYYDFNRRERTLLYSDRMIYSPACPIFRDDEGALLAQPYMLDILTSPAPNKGAITQNQRAEIAQVPARFARRMALMLALFAHKGCTHLVLGAWGCGVFGNDPEEVAALYEDKLVEEGFGKLFEQITFAIYEPREHGPCYTAFMARFSAHMS